MHNTIKLNGELVIETITKQITIINKHLLSNNLIIDLSNINKIDTAGVATLLELKNQAKNSLHKISYINTSDNIKNLCNLYQITL